MTKKTAFFVRVYIYEKKHGLIFDVELLSKQNGRNIEDIL